MKKTAGNNGNGTELKRRRKPMTLESYLDLKNTSFWEVFRRLVNLGLTDKELAGVYGLSVMQFHNLKASSVELQKFLEEERMRPNFLVEQALFKRAIGYQFREMTLENGKPVKMVIKEAFPDVTAQIFWLKNRQPDRWRDVQHIDLTLKDRMSRVYAAQKTKGAIPDKTEG